MMDKRWLEQYQKGVPHTINTDAYSSLVDFIDQACSNYSASEAYVNFGCTLTYSALEILSRDFASYLQSLGLEKGARIAIMMPNNLQYPVAIYAILRAGYIVVNTNPLYTPTELTHQINDSGAETILVMANFATTVEKSLPHMPKVKHIIVTELGDLFPTVKRIIVNFVIKHIKKMVPAFHLPEAISFRNALKIGKSVPFKKVEITKDDIAFLQYTGGTTGVAKGAILSHGNMVANVLQARSWVDPLVRVHEETVITALPLYHIFSLTANCLTFLCYGAKNILITNPRDLPQFIDAIKNAKFTVITGVNTLFNALLNHPQFDTIDFSHLKIALSGGMSLQKSVSLRWRERTKSRVLEAYGLTETSPAATMNPMYLEEYNGSIGLPIPSTDVIVINDNEEELPIGEIGELCIKGPQVMQGYWHKPEETALVFTKSGFLKTGDLVKMDTEGYIYLVDRKKDMIIISGFNVYPNEVEQVIGMCPGVLEVGVIGVKDESGGEIVKACVVKKDPELTAEKIIAHCRESLTGYKIPKLIEFYSELPKTNVGKILHRALS